MLWPHAWFTEIIFWKVCGFILYVYACLYVFSHPQEQNFISQKQPVYKNEGYSEPVLNLLQLFQQLIYIHQMPG